MYKTQFLDRFLFSLAGGILCSLLVTQSLFVYSGDDEIVLENRKGVVVGSRIIDGKRHTMIQDLETAKIILTASALARTVISIENFNRLLRRVREEGVLEELENDDYIKEIYDVDGRTLLHLAVLGGHERLAEDLISRGLSPNERDRNYRTPAYYAAEVGSQRLLERLLPEEVTEQDMNDLRDIATRNEHGHILEYLRTRGNDINTDNREGAISPDCTTAPQQCTEESR